MPVAVKLVGARLSDHVDNEGAGLAVFCRVAVGEHLKLLNFVQGGSEGVAARAGYALSDAVIFSVTWNYAWRINDNLGTGGPVNAIGINPIDQYQLFFADLNIKF